MNLSVGELHRVGPAVYGDPYRAADGSTIITAAHTSGGGRSRPLGLFVIKDGDVTWVPAIDSSRVMFVGALTGLVAATLATVAVLRRPPWPDIRMVVRR